MATMPVAFQAAWKQLLKSRISQSRLAQIGLPSFAVQDGSHCAFG